MAKRGRSRKSKAEEKVERITWFLLVLIFGFITIAQENLDITNIPNWFIPMSGAVVLLGSGIYQYSKRWTVSPITWLTGTVLLMFGLVNILVDQSLNLTGLSLIAFAAVILFGLLTNET